MNLIFKPHCSTTIGYNFDCMIQPTVTDQVAWSVTLSACHTSEPCKNGCTVPDAIWVKDLGGPREPCIRRGSRSPMGRGNFEGKGVSNCKV